MQHPVLTGSIRTLRELERAISELDDHTYQMPVEILSGSSVGQHVRHIVEFYQCVFEQFSGKLIAYSQRRRDASIETQLAVARQACYFLMGQLEQQWEDLPLQLEMEHMPESYGVQPITTSLYRELLYCLEHAIHHMAILKIGLAEVAPQVALPSHFGVAPSTIVFREQACVQ